MTSCLHDRSAPKARAPRPTTILVGVIALMGSVLASACSAPPGAASISQTPAAHSLTPGDTEGSSGGGSSDALSAGDRKARTLETAKEARGDETRGRCPRSMVEIEGRFCIDRYEASLVDVLPNGDERPRSPFTPLTASGPPVRAVSSPNVFPQGYISAVEAQAACTAAGKRLCRVAEWGKACRGPDPKSFGYADRREPGRCNDKGRNPVLSLYGRGQWNWKTMNQPELNQLESTLSRTGEHSGCTNGYGVYDMVGNLHEWVADPRGTFYGGYYQDVSSVGHGEGCGYQTTAHEARYHDYSTGFRCCADLAGSASASPLPSPKAPAKRRGKR